MSLSIQAQFFSRSWRRNLPEDIIRPNLSGTDMSYARPTIFGHRNADNFNFLLVGSNANIWKAMPHVGPRARIGAYNNREFTWPLIYRTPQSWNYPYLSYSQNPQRFSGDTWVEIVTGSMYHYLHFFNPQQGSSVNYPGTFSRDSRQVALSRHLQLDSAGNIYILLADVDGLSVDTSRSWSVNGLDNDSLYLARWNYAQQKFVPIDTFRHRANVDASFDGFFGYFDYDSILGRTRYLRRDSLFIFRDRAEADTIIEVPGQLAIESLSQLAGENISYHRCLIDTAAQKPYAVQFLRWQFLNNAFVVDSFRIDLPTELFWPQNLSFDPNPHHYYLDPEDGDLVLDFVRFEEILPEAFVAHSLLLKIDQEGRYLWHREMFGPKFPALIETFSEIRDTLVIGGQFCGFLINPEIGQYPRYYSPFFRRIDPQGNILAKNNQVIPDNQVQIFPNPFRVDIQIRGISSRVEILDGQGKMIHSFLPDPHDIGNQIFLPDLESGIYFLRYRNAQGEIKVERLMKLPY